MEELQHGPVAPHSDEIRIVVGMKHMLTDNKRLTRDFDGVAEDSPRMRHLSQSIAESFCNTFYATNI